MRNDQRAVWVVGAIAVVWGLNSCINSAESRGVDEGRNDVYSAEAERRAHIRSGLCDSFQGITLAEIEQDSSRLGEAVDDALSYGPDGRNIIGFQDSYVIEAVVRDCPRYLGAVIAEVDDWIEYQGEGQYGY